MGPDGIQWLSDDEQATWRALNMAGRLVDGALDRQLIRDADMGHAHYAILVALSEATDGQTRMGDLAESLQFSPSRLSHAIRKLEGSRWVVREQCPSDGRGQIAVLTRAGREKIERVAPGHVNEVRRLVLDPLTTIQQHQLREACELLVGTMQQDLCDDRGSALLD